MDSLFNRSISLHAKRQICAILFPQTETITVKSVAVQQQTGGIDCGLFAVAFIEHLARTNTYPSDVWFDQTKMRNHALKCLKNNALLPFPTVESSSKKKKRAIVKEITLKIFCVCRTIWTASDKRVNGK